MSYIFSDYNNMVGKRPRQAYWQELQDAVVEVDKRVEGIISGQLYIVSPRLGTDPITDYIQGVTSFKIEETVSSGFPTVDGIVETIYIDEYRNIQHFFESRADGTSGKVSYRQWNAELKTWTPWQQLITEFVFKEHTDNLDIHLQAGDRQRINGYTHRQSTPSDNWLIEHGMDKYPSVSVTDSSGSLVMGDVNYISKTSLQVIFSAPFAGTAYLS